MSTPNVRAPKGPASDRGLVRPIRNRVDISYAHSASRSTSPPDEIELSWEHVRGNKWPSDAWVVSADVHPDLWPETFGEEDAHV